MPTTMDAAIRTCRILYYGPAGSGKRENLARIQSSLPAEHRLAVATTDPSRQIAFMLRNGNQGDWQVFVQALDTGREPAVASGSEVPFDGIVFVCDSRPGKLDECLSAMEGLKSYLDCWRLDIMAVPMVLQYNHRDAAGVLPVDRLESLLNPWGLLSFPAVASSGEGIREPLKAILSLTIGNILQRQPSPANPMSRQPEIPTHDLDIDPNPPVPGTPHTPGWDGRPAVRAPGVAARSVPAPSVRNVAPTAEVARPAAAPGPRAATVTAAAIQVRVPRSALGPDGTGTLLLEIEVVDG